MNTRSLEGSSEDNVYNDTISLQYSMQTICVQPCGTAIVTPPVLVMH
jgi:hypothetical protein